MLHGMDLRLKGVENRVTVEQRKAGCPQEKKAAKAATVAQKAADTSRGISRVAAVFRTTQPLSFLVSINAFYIQHFPNTVFHAQYTQNTIPKPRSSPPSPQSANATRLSPASSTSITLCARAPWISLNISTISNHIRDFFGGKGVHGLGSSQEKPAAKSSVS